MGYEYDEAVLKCFFEAAGQAVSGAGSRGNGRGGSLPGGLHGGCCGFQSCGDGVF